MTQTVLSIDTSRQPAAVVLARVEGGRVEILERHSLDLASLFSTAHAPEHLATGTTGATSGATIAETPPNTSLPAGIEELRALIQKAQVPWYRTVLIVPADNALPLNIELPFGDQRKLARVLDLEVQDVVPFDLNEFLIAHRIVAGFGDRNFDIHVNLVPREHISNAIETCRRAAFDPRVVTSPVGALAAAPLLAPDYFPANYVLVHVSPDFISMLVVADGKQRYGKVIASSATSSHANFVAIREMKLTLTAQERRYNVTFEQVYLLGSHLHPSDLQAALGREVQHLPLTDLVENSSEQDGLAGLAAALADDFETPIFVNYRTREFAYRPQLQELVSGLRALLPYLALAFGTLILSLAVTYFTRAHRIDSMTASIKQRLTQQAGISGVPASGAAARIAQELETLEAQLKDLGSFSKLSPLDAFLAISRDIPAEVARDLSITTLSIRENKISIKGSVPTYAPLDQIEKKLKEQGAVYCEVRSREDASGASGGRYGFELTLLLC